MSFHEVRLPARLAFGSTGGVERRTHITTLASGFERRSTPWAMGRRRYLIGANLRSLDDMAELTAFFEARRGRLFGLHFAWTARVRAGGDSWEREAVPVDAARWRVRIMDGDDLVRVFEVEDEAALYATADVVADWPGGVSDDAVVAVAQWGPGFGWGVETTLRMIAL